MKDKDVQLGLMGKDTENVDGDVGTDENGTFHLRVA